MPTDEQLIEEILDGSQAALEVLIKRYYKGIFAFVYRKVGEYHYAYDITQEVFIKVIKTIPQYKEKNKFQNWLLTIALNCCRDYFRNSHFKVTPMDVEVEKLPASSDNQPIDFLSKQAQREDVKAAINRLPEYQKDAIILRFYHDLKIKDIAKVTKSNEATVKSRLKQGMEKLRKLLIGGDSIETDFRRGTAE